MAWPIRREELPYSWLACRVGAVPCGVLSLDSRTAGSGKSRIIEGLYGSENPVTKILDLDAEMSNHPRFDPLVPSTIYEEDGAYNWANCNIEQKFQAAVLDDRITHVVVRRVVGCGRF